MNKVRDEAAEKYAESFLLGQTMNPRDCFSAGWDKALRFEPRVLDIIAMVEHAIHNGYLGEGSTKGWAERCLKSFE